MRKRVIVVILLAIILSFNLLPIVKAADVEEEEMTLKYNSSIKGKVTDDGTGEGVKDVLVKLLNEDGTDAGEEYHQRTDENGDYEITPPAGNYKLQFVVGDIGEEGTSDQIDPADTERIKNVLKHNGQDYFVSTPPHSTGENYSYGTREQEIATMGENDIQVVFAVDTSGSTASSINSYEGGVHTILEAEKESLKSLIDELLNGDQPIWIGMIFFDSNAYGEIPVTRDEDTLFRALDSVTYGGNTNTPEAIRRGSGLLLDKSKNKVLTVVTDGYPTHPGTADELINLRNQGIKTMTVLLGGGGDSESFNSQTCDLLITAENGAQFIDAIENQLNKEIQNAFESSVISNVSTYDITYSTEEDKQRDIAVANNFRDGFRWGNLNMFLPIDNYNNSSTDTGEGTSYEEAHYLSERTYFTITSNDSYNINEPDSRINTTEEKTDWKGRLRKRIKYNGEAVSSEANLGISEKNPAEVNIKVYTSGLKVTLANGQVAYNGISNYDVDKEKILPLVCFLDSEITQGARIDVEYSIHITAKSPNVIFDKLQIINHMPQGLVFDAGSQLLTEAGKTNGDYWNELLSRDDIKDDEYINQNYPNLKRELGYDHVVSKNITLGDVGTTNDIELKIVGSMIAGGPTDLDYVSNPDRAEVYSYQTRNTLVQIADSAYATGTPRRMKAAATVTSSDLNSSYLYAGTFGGADYTSSDDNANVVAVLPPTGEYEPLWREPVIIAVLVALEIILALFYTRLKIKIKLSYIIKRK